MRKTNISLLFLTVSLLAACHAAQPTATPAVAAVSAPVSAPKAAAPADPVLPVAAQTAIDKPVPSAQATPVKNTISSPPPAAPAAQETTVPPALAPALPAADQAVFKDEKLIDFTDRALHPYAALAPDPAARQTAPWAYEQLKYGIYYSFVKAGTAYIRNRGLVSVDGRAAYLLQTTAFSAPVIDTVFKVRDVNQSWLDAEKFYSLGYGQSVREGGYRRDEWLRFDYAGRKYRGQVQKKEEPRPIEGALEIPVLDMLSSLYCVRAQKLQIGQDIVFDIVNREKQYPLVVKVLKKERVKTAAGSFDCVVVEPQIRGEGIFVSKGKSLKVWLTDDVYKMPVKMKVEVFIGSVSAELLEFKRQAPANIL